jgi:hypothetical protein
MAAAAAIAATAAYELYRGSSYVLPLLDPLDDDPRYGIASAWPSPIPSTPSSRATTSLLSSLSASWNVYALLCPLSQLGFPIFLVRSFRRRDPARRKSKVHSQGTFYFLFHTPSLPCAPSLPIATQNASPRTRPCGPRATAGLN